MELFKLYEQNNLQFAIDFLSKAYYGAVKNYGHESPITKSLQETLNHSNLKKTSIREKNTGAISIIKEENMKKNRKLVVDYDW